MAYEENITVTKDGQEATIKSASWRVYERNGWTRADDGSSEGTSAPADSEPNSEAPAENTTTRKAD